MTTTAGKQKAMAKVISQTASVLFASAVLCVSALATPPVVSKIEPPDWWIGHSWNPVRLLIEGRNLAGAQLLPTAGLAVGEAKVSTNGNWVFVDLTIATDAKPGRRALTLTTPGGSTVVPFEVLRRPSAKGRFQGFSPDDVIYLTMPDRFASSATGISFRIGEAGMARPRGETRGVMTGAF